MAKILVVLITWVVTQQLKMIALALKVVKIMGDNVATYATPDVVLTVLKDAATRLQTAYNNRLNGDDARREYVAAAENLDLLLHNQAIYVNGVAKGSAAKIALSGFDSTTNDRVKKNKTAAPGPVDLQTPGGGLLKLKVGAVTDADSYIYIIFLDVVSIITVGANYVRTTTDSIIITKRNLSEIIEGLTIGITVTVVALTQNAGGISPAGPSTTKLIN